MAQDTGSNGTAAPAQPASKGAAATPKLNNDVEMGSLPGDPGDKPAAETDIMQMARIGDVRAIEKAFAETGYDATFSDDEGITPLHVRCRGLFLILYSLSPLSSPVPCWAMMSFYTRSFCDERLSSVLIPSPPPFFQWAAINNQYTMCKFLIEHGAEINKKGGESVATPLQWAAQRCHYYTVHLLLQHGADPLITDAQGYNTLHISTFNGNVFLITLLLHQGIPVDVLDSFGHTGLMWSAYKGYPQCVDVFLRWGASVHARDEQGFTALHWALVKGSPGCIQKLIEYGADRFAKTTTGKTPAITAQELHTEAAWHRALQECGYDEDGHQAVPSFPGASYLLQDRRGFVTKFTFLCPFIIVEAMLVVMAGMPVFAGLPIALLIGYCMQWAALQVLAFAPPDMRQLQRTVRH